jgi:hypothetical protein
MFGRRCMFIQLENQFSNSSVVKTREALLDNSCQMFNIHHKQNWIYIRFSVMLTLLQHVFAV